MRILIVEDEVAIREFEVINLRRVGYETVEAGSGEEALAIYEEHGDIDNLNIDITNINSDSRKIKEKGLFVAINGFTKDGTEFIPNAIQKNKKEIADRIISNNDTDISNLSFNDYDYLLS